MKGTYGAVGVTQCRLRHLEAIGSLSEIELFSQRDFRELKTDLSQKKFADTTTPQRVRVHGLRRKAVIR
jgi:hypothetical protein